MIQDLPGFLRLSRASLAPSAAADAIAGYAIAWASLSAAGSVDGDGWSISRLLFAMTCSVALFLVGMSQNDIADRKKDASGRPERPLPSGQVSLGRARLFAIGCASVAVVLVAGFGGTAARLLVASLLISITGYNLLPGHAGRVGPILLGLIRGQNLCLGAAIGGSFLAALPVAGVYALYIGAVSFAARMEDGEVAYRRSSLIGWIRVAEVAALLAPVVASGRVQGIPLAVTAYLVFRVEGALSKAAAVEPPPPPALPRLIGTCLGSILLLDASLVLAVGSPVAGAAMLLFFPVGRQLVQRYPPS